MGYRFCVGAAVTNTIKRFPDDFGCSVACDKSGNTFDTPDTNSYLYNTRSELTSATAAVDAAYRYGYNFDDIGNRRASAERGVNSAYMANWLNQYTAVDDFAPVYDADGNQTRVKTATGVWSVTYNGENRLVRWQQGPTVITMSFDRMGRRVTKNDQRFVYNGYLQIANFRSTTTTSDYNYFIWDPTEPVATRPIAWHHGSSVAYYTHDGNKNVSEVIDSNNDVAAHYEYAPFGALTASRGASASANPWRFSSEYAEDDTATVYYNYRHYEPVTGRWLQRDPIGDFAVAYYIASVGSESQKMWILNSSSELRNQLVRNRTLRRLLGFSQRKKISIGKETAVLLYVVANNDLINNLDERGAVAQWLAGCGIGACWGGIGGLAASALGGLRSAVCGLASGAISGCAAGWACSTLNPQICLAGSCVGGFLGAIANTMCSNGESLKDGCAWASAILSSSLSCMSGFMIG